MASKHDFESIRNLYLSLYNESIQKRRELLSFNVEDWHKTLYEIPLKVYNDIKSIGVFLYPIYPIGDYFVDFGNPFKKVGIEILYKEHQRQEKLDSIEYFEKRGWTIYRLESKYVEPSAEELYRRENIDLKGAYLYEDENMFDFFEKHKYDNSECLIYYIREKHSLYSKVITSHSESDY
jgi:hypothetical protein